MYLSEVQVFKLPEDNKDVSKHVRASTVIPRLTTDPANEFFG